ncbi:MAG: trypsin-like peptidase domain-containing protein [Bdellovibrionaceae bacterium]|nr:trypsin-like peptidase domain-containing protein [Pseudobdellovibrionaceae bacterium]
MKIQLVVRFNGYAIDKMDLAPGEYTLGRDPELSININHPSIHRNHGKIYFKDSQWFYEDYSTRATHAVSDFNTIRLSTVLELATAAYVASETTGEIAAPRFGAKTKKDKIIYGAVGAVSVLALALLSYFIIKSQNRLSDPNVLLSQVRSKVVEFEKIKNDEAIRDFKEFGGFADKDFRDNVGYCTGFLVAPNIVLTASHCLWGNDYLDLQTDFELRAYDGKKFKPIRVLGFDSVRDYLFLEMSGMEAYGHLDFADTYKIGQTVYTLGNAHGQGIAIREGIMANETEDVNDPSIKYIRFSAGASPGNSGGPLLDMDGRLVALVFAATGAENYNLGTSVYDIKKGFESFVKNKNPKEIKVNARKLFQFNPHAFLSKQVLPYLADYNDFPELSQKVQELQFVFKAPIEFGLLSEAILGEVFAKSEKVVTEIENELLQKNEIILDWKSFATAKFPAIHPSQFDGSQNSFYKIKDRYYMKLAGFLDSPSKKEFKQYAEQFSKEKKFDFQAYGMNTELVLNNTGSILYEPKDTAKTREYIEELAQGSLYSQFLLDAKITDENLVERFLKNYLGEEGVLTSTYSAFIKPQSYKQFFIKEIKKTPDVADVTDGNGREWKRFHILLFDNLHTYIYCMNFPEGATCAARILPVENEFRLSMVEAHFREHILSHFLENPYFWKPQALVQFKGTPNGKSLPSLRGLEFAASDSGYNFKIPYFGVQFKLPLNMQSVRMQTGIYRDSKEGAIWTGYGADWIQTGATTEICGIGIEPKGTQSTFVLNFERDMQKKLKLKEDKDMKKEDIPKLWTEDVIAKNGIPITVYGYCAPLRDNPIEIGFYFVDYKKAKPLKASYVK